MEVQVGKASNGQGRRTKDEESNDIGQFSFLRLLCVVVEMGWRKLHTLVLLLVVRPASNRTYPQTFIVTMPYYLYYY